MRIGKTAIALLLAGSFFCCGHAGRRVPSAVEVNGVEVGGMPYAVAAERVRKTLTVPPFFVRSPAGDLSPELEISDDVEKVLKSAKRGGRYTAHAVRRWVDAEEELEALCRRNAKDSVNASVTFGKEGFSYTSGEKGIACDFSRLLLDVSAALEEGREEVTLSPYEYAPEVTEEMLKERTRLLSSFSTAYDPKNAPRSHNIELSAKQISGTTVGAGEEFSFNEAVGARTAERGYKEAPVIQDGLFTQGVGGGVCQTSTTLFGAVLRAGLTVTESHPHSLSVGYVPPSEDAMVSSSSDLKFVNPYPYPVYLRAETGGGRVAFFIYGMPDGIRYEVESRVLFRLEPPPPRIVEGEEDRTVRPAKCGLASESWLILRDKAGKELSRSRIRCDTYACVQGIEERAPAPPAEDPSAEEEELFGGLPEKS